MTQVQSKVFAIMLKSMSVSAGNTDRDLIERFRDNDSAAFAELVARYAPMVRDVCCRVQPSWHDAEDACQAVFLILAKKACNSQWNPSIANWLYTTARHVAFRANRANTRRIRREVQATPQRRSESVLDQMTGREVLLALDEELAHLPTRYREPVILCCLVGLSREKAAARLGWSPGSLKARLERGRKQLGAALSRRGIVPTAALLTVIGAVPVGACPNRLLDSILAAVGGSRSAAAAQLAREILTKGSVKVKVWSTIAIGIVVLGFGVTASLSSVGRSIAEENGRRAYVPLGVSEVLWVSRQDNETLQLISKPLPEKPVREGEIVVWQKGTCTQFKPDGTKVRGWKGEEVHSPGGVRLSPDGKTIALLRTYETRTKKQNVAVGGAALRGTFTRHLFRVTLYPVQEKLDGVDLDIPGDSVETALWSADGSKIYISTHADDENYSRDKDLKHYVFDVATRKSTELKLPAGHHLIDVSPDGKRYLINGPGPKPTDARQAFVASADGGEPVRLSEPNEALYDGRFSPDGTTALLTGFRNGQAPGVKPGSPVAEPALTLANAGWLVTVPVNAPKKRTVLALKDREYANQCRWSPDGKRVVAARQVLPEFNKDAPPMEIVVTDADGKNPKIITRDTGKHLDPVFIDWR